MSSLSEHKEWHCHLTPQRGVVLVGKDWLLEHTQWPQLSSWPWPSSKQWTSALNGLGDSCCPEFTIQHCGLLNSICFVSWIWPLLLQNSIVLLARSSPRWLLGPGDHDSLTVSLSARNLQSPHPCNNNWDPIFSYFMKQHLTWSLFVLFLFVSCPPKWIFEFDLSHSHSPGREHKINNKILKISYLSKFNLKHSFRNRQNNSKHPCRVKRRKKQ